MRSHFLSFKKTPDNQDHRTMKLSSTNQSDTRQVINSMTDINYLRRLATRKDFTNLFYKDNNVHILQDKSITLLIDFLSKYMPEKQKNISTTDGDNTAINTIEDINNGDNNIDEEDQRQTLFSEMKKKDESEANNEQVATSDEPVCLSVDINENMVCFLFLQLVLLVILLDYSDEKQKQKEEGETETTDENEAFEEVKQNICLELIPAMRASSLKLIESRNTLFDVLIARVRYWSFISMEKFNNDKGSMILPESIVNEEIELAPISKIHNFYRTTASGIAIILRALTQQGDWKRASDFLAVVEFPKEGIRTKSYVRYLYYSGLIRAVYWRDFEKAAEDLKEADRRLAKSLNTSHFAVHLCKLSFIVDILRGLSPRLPQQFASGVCREVRKNRVKRRIPHIIFICKKGSAKKRKKERNNHS